MMIVLKLARSVTFKKRWLFVDSGLRGPGANMFPPVFKVIGYMHVFSLYIAHLFESTGR